MPACYLLSQFGSTGGCSAAHLLCCTRTLFVQPHHCHAVQMLGADGSQAHPANHPCPWPSGLPAGTFTECKSRLPAGAHCRQVPAAGPWTGTSPGRLSGGGPGRLIGAGASARRPAGALGPPPRLAAPTATAPHAGAPPAPSGGGPCRATAAGTGARAAGATPQHATAAGIGVRAAGVTLAGSEGHTPPLLVLLLSPAASVTYRRLGGVSPATPSPRRMTVMCVL